MKKVFFWSALILCFVGRGCAFGASAPIQNYDELDNIKPISALTDSKPQPVKAAATKQTSSIQSSTKQINAVKAQIGVTQIPPVQPEPVDFKNCNKFFKLDSQKLFYLTLAGVNANRFTINEIQSKSGYVLFTAGQKQFLASVFNIDDKNSMLKITPCTNVYYFPIGIVQNMFKYIELNINTPIERLSIL